MKLETLARIASLAVFIAQTEMHIFRDVTPRGVGVQVSLVSRAGQKTTERPIRVGVRARLVTRAENCIT